MPIFIKDFSWRETESQVYISVPLKGGATSQIAIVSTDDYLRVTLPPFIFEAILKAEVEDSKNVAKIHDGVVEFTLTKKVPELWGSLNETGLDKNAVLEKRKIAEQKVTDREARVKQERCERRVKDRDYSVKQQIERESEDKDRIQQLKNDEKEKVTAEIKTWKEKDQKAKDNQRACKERNASEISKKVNKNPAEIKRKKKLALSAKAELPPPRENANLAVTFTPRVFPTAARESQAEEEQKWLDKQAEARRILAKKENIDKDKKPEECDPEWLKEKGDSFFKIGNYYAAINAYSEAIDVNPNLPYLYSNRAACHLKVRNLHKTIEDSSKALDLLDPPVPSNAKLRLKSLVRRGAAFCNLNLLKEGLMDYEAALKIEPQNEELNRDIFEIKQKMSKD